MGPRWRRLVVVILLVGGCAAAVPWLAGASGRGHDGVRLTFDDVEHGELSVRSPYVLPPDTPAAPSPAPAPVAAPPGPAAAAAAQPGAPAPFPSPPPPGVAALALGRAVPLYPGPGAAQPARSLPNPTVEQVPLAFLVRQSQSGWVQVQVPTRPNGATAWVRASDVQLAPVPTTIVIELGLHRLTAFQGDRVVLSEPVADGTNHTPTPTGDFFVDAKVKVNNPNGPYGPWQLSVAAFSDVLRRFGGGNGQIAIHGTPGSWAMGQSVSHGCVRMTNAAITRLAGLAPVGTPVSIRP